ncbi:MAG: hypothetical protein ACT4O2_12930 [Beijerinckiaceae bacterium]
MRGSKPAKTSIIVAPQIKLFHQVSNHVRHVFAAALRYYRGTWLHRLGDAVPVARLPNALRCHRDLQIWA